MIPGGLRRQLTPGPGLRVLICLCAGVVTSVLTSPVMAGDADLVLRNGVVYTVDAARSWATTVVVKDGRFVAAGDDAVADEWTSDETEVVDLQGRFVLPAFHDAHAHPVHGGLSHSRCPLHEGNTPSDYQRLVARCLEESPGDDWIYGVGWRPGVFPPDGVPHKKLLDEIAPLRPVAMHSIGGHSLWLNSQALEAAGITADTPDPPQGRIDRDPRTGEPVGGLQESAMDLVAGFLPPPSAEEYRDGLNHGLRYFNRNGIVGWQDANVPVIGPDPGVLEAYIDAARRGELTGHVSLALQWENSRGPEQLPELLKAAERLRKEDIRAKTVKFFLDGVLGQRTAALLDSYTDAPDTSGELLIPPGVFSEAVVELDSLGYQVHVHAIGDLAIRSALDAFAQARERNGFTNNRHLISHANLVTPVDQPRFARLSVIGIFQPLWARWDDYMHLTAERVGTERMSFMYPSGSLVRRGATVAFGSDWAVASANPLLGLEVAMTRREPGQSDGRALVPEQGLPLGHAIASYTINAAYVSHVDDLSGSIEPGKSADLVILSRNLFETPAHEIAGTEVLLTLFAGQVVHGDVSDVAKRNGD